MQRLIDLEQNMDRWRDTERGREKEGRERKKEKRKILTNKKLRKNSLDIIGEHIEKIY